MRPLGRKAAGVTICPESATGQHCPCYNKLGNLRCRREERRTVICPDCIVKVRHIMRQIGPLAKAITSNL
jgi:hypothetical protein